MSFKNTPLEQDDLLTEFSLLYSSYNQDRASSYRQFMQKNQASKPNLFMSMKQSYLNIVHSITKNAVSASLVMLLALTTVSASAAQLTAPEEFKPSTLVANLFAANKQKETDPYTALKPDENNDVAISNECDLAMKYPRIISRSKVNIFRENESVPLTEPSVIDGFNVSAYPNVMEEFEAQVQEGGKVEAEKVVTFRCLEMSKLDAMKNYFDKRVSELGAQKLDFSKEQLRELTGWFVTEADIQNLNYTLGDNYSGQDHNEIYFTFNNKIYWVIFSSPSSQTKGMFGNQVQIQFNSLVKNEANSEILESPFGQTSSQSQDQAPVVSSNINSSQSSTIASSIGRNVNQNSSANVDIQALVADENYDVVVIEECDLAIKLKKLSNRTVSKGFANGLNMYSVGDIFNIRCQKNKSFEDFLNQDVKALPIPNIDKIQQTQQVGDIKSKINGDLQTRRQGDFTLESYTDSKGVVVFELKNSSIIVLIAASNPGADLSEIVEIQANSLAPSAPSLSNFVNNSANNSILTFQDEEFLIIGGGQMRWKNDASGGYLLKKMSDGKTYILMSSVKDSFKESALTAPSASSYVISGQAISAKDQDIVTGDGTTPDYIITNLSDISE